MLLFQTPVWGSKGKVYIWQTTPTWSYFPRLDDDSNCFDPLVRDHYRVHGGRTAVGKKISRGALYSGQPVCFPFRRPPSTAASSLPSNSKGAPSPELLLHIYRLSLLHLQLREKLILFSQEPDDTSPTLSGCPRHCALGLNSQSKYCQNRKDNIQIRGAAPPWWR